MLTYIIVQKSFLWCNALFLFWIWIVFVITKFFIVFPGCNIYNLLSARSHSNLYRNIYWVVPSQPSIWWTCMYKITRSVFIMPLNFSPLISFHNFMTIQFFTRFHVSVAQNITFFILIDLNLFNKQGNSLVTTNCTKLFLISFKVFGNHLVLGLK